MSEVNKPVTEEELHAYVDGQLDAQRRAEVELWLAANPEAAEQVRAWRAQNEALRAMFDPVLDEPVPPHLSEVLKPREPRWGLSSAAAVAWLALGSIIGFLVHDGVAPSPATPRFAEQAAVAHVVYTAEVRHPVEVGADQQEHLLKWLSKRLGKPLHTPDFTPMGYQLVGGRLLPGESGPAAQFMYEDGQKQRLTLYVSIPGEPHAEFQYGDEDGVKVLYWADAGLSFALVGGIDKGRLMEMAHAAYAAFGS